MSKRKYAQENGFVCFAIMSHGSNMYKDGKPMTFRLQRQVAEYNKITYCYYGGWNVMDDEDVRQILDALNSTQTDYFINPDK
jgi:hypothetical protein